VDLAAVVSEVAESLRGLVEERGHQLTLARPAGALLVRGDRQRLTQVVTNLVWNSAKFTPAGGHVDLLLTRDDDHVMLRVRDDGIGIAPEKTDRIFRLFEHAGAPDDHGLGIGLSLVQLIVALHGGEITVHSEGSGCGSEFTVRLPAAHVRVTPAVGRPRT
jgi:signal transduction histidine kinase